MLLKKRMKPGLKNTYTRYFWINVENKAYYKPVILHSNCNDKGSLEDQKSSLNC